MGFTDSVSDGIRLKNLDGVTIGISDCATLGLIDNTMLGVTDSENLEYNLVVSKVHYLVFLIELLKAYLNIPCLALMKEVMNTTHLALMNQTLKESRKDLHLDLRITLLTVIYYKLQRDLLTSILME